jgi:hypothetical protein
MIASLIFSLLFSAGCFTFVAHEADKTAIARKNEVIVVTKPLEGEETLNEEFRSNKGKDPSPVN